jgi:hypothetical protein
MVRSTVLAPLTAVTVRIVEVCGHSETVEELAVSVIKEDSGVMSTKQSVRWPSVTFTTASPSTKKRLRDCR